MNRHGLRTRILIYSILPLLIVGLATMTYFLFSNYTRLNNKLIEHGREILSPLATSLSYAMSQSDEILAQGLINEFHRQNSRDVLAISVFDHDNNMLVTSSSAPEINQFRLDPLKNQFIYESASVDYSENGGIIMRMPIYTYNEADMLKLYVDKTKSPYEGEEEQLSFTNSKINYPRPVAGYVCIYLITQQTVIDMYSSVTMALVVLGLGILFSLLFGINLNRIIVDPINRLTTTIYEIREGNVNTKVNGIMYGELERLRNYINSMADSMTEYHNQMQYSVDEATNDLRQTLDLLDDQNNKLDSALNQANEASKIKSEFLANMSHELRTPLNGIIGFAQQLYKTPLRNNQSEYLQTIERSAKNLLSIVNNILDFSKLEAGKLSFEEIPFSLRKACYETVNLLTPTVYQKGIELTVNIDPDVHDYVIGDPIRVGQILTNLLGNAIKFTKNGNVALKISKMESNGIPITKINLAVSVRDTGIGIDPEKQTTLFKPFTQADSSISRRYGGTGLGLIITSHLIEQMGGKISLTSEPGQGTTFNFNIILNKGISPVLNIKTPEQRALAHNRVVVIENNTWVRDSIKSILQEIEMDVFAVSTTGAINALATADSPDYIVIGQPSNFEFNRLLTTFNALDLSKVKKVIVAVNTMDEKVHKELLDLSDKVSVLVKPVTSEKILQALLSQGAESLPHHESSETPKIQNTAPDASEEKTEDTASSTSENKTEEISSTNTNLIPASILAVDDNPINLSLIKALLKDLVTDVYTASDGHDAIEQCLHTEFDLIFMDIQMPIMDGVTTMKNIKKGVNNRETPIVAVTALVVKEEQERFIREGMADYMSKPLDEELLKKMVLKYCKAAPAAITGEKKNDEQTKTAEEHPQHKSKKIKVVKKEEAVLTEDKAHSVPAVTVTDTVSGTQPDTKPADRSATATDAKTSAASAVNLSRIPRVAGKSAQKTPSVGIKNPNAAKLPIRTSVTQADPKPQENTNSNVSGKPLTTLAEKKSPQEGIKERQAQPSATAKATVTANSVNNVAGTQPKVQTAPAAGNALWTVTEALTRAANKKDLAVDMLQGFLDSIPKFENDYQKLKKGNEKELAPVIHKFAGGAVYCGMPKVKELCNTIELAIKQGSTVDDLEPELLELEDFIENIKKNGQGWLKQLKSTSVPPKK